MTEAVANPAPKRKFDLNMVQVLDLGCGIINQIVLKQPKPKAKALLKELKGGKQVSLGNINLNSKNAEGDVQDSMQIPLYLELDYSEFKGGGFGFPVFQAAVQAMLKQVATTLRAKKDLNLLTNQETGGVLVHQPGVINMSGQYNVLVIMIQPGKNLDITLRLMFIDPAQYPSLNGG